VIGAGPAAERVVTPYAQGVSTPLAAAPAGPRVRTYPIPDPGRLLERLPAETSAAWVHRGEGLVGWGVAASWEVTGDERFSRTQRQWGEWCQRAHIEDPLEIPGSGPVAFGTFTFDPNPASGSRSLVVVPRVLVGRRDGRSWITVVGDGEPTIPPVTVPEPPTQVDWSRGTRTSQEWQDSVAEVINRIGRGELDKVVLARDIVAEVGTDFDPRYLLLRLEDAYPECWTFRVGNMIGATPELLVRRTGDDVLSRVLAGTVKRRGDATVDASLAQALLGSGKDLEEHEYAVHSVARALAAHCTDLDVPERPHVLRLANVQHLATDVTGRLADDAPAVALAASLPRCVGRRPSAPSPRSAKSRGWIEAATPDRSAGSTRAAMASSASPCAAPRSVRTSYGCLPGAASWLARTPRLNSLSRGRSSFPSVKP